jgi:hypothetical protein
MFIRIDDNLVMARQAYNWDEKLGARDGGHIPDA